MTKQINKILVVTFLLFLLSGCETLKGVISDIMNDNTDEILLYLQKGDKERLRKHFTASAACKGTRKLLQEGMLTTPVYTKNRQSNCVADNVYTDDKGEYFTDKSCTQSVAFQPTDYQVFCKEIIDLDKSYTVMGNAAIWKANDTPIDNSPGRKWTIPYGAKMKLTLESLKGNTVPYMKRVNYKTIENIRNTDGSSRGNGTCKLEMRVYKKDITAKNLQPLMSIHGGSWKLRSAGFPGLESSISHYTDQGFIVFAPFYRLVGNKEANAECNNTSWQNMVTDVEDALKWVWRNGEVLGATRNQSVSLSGQSAGAHLASWLLAHPERHSVPIGRSLLLYPPTDLEDFANNSVPGGKYEAFTDGIKTIENFFGIDDISKISTADLQANAFPDLVKRNPNSPPVFIIHGVADKVVPSNQSVRLCNAYMSDTGAIDIENSPAINDGGDPSAGIYMRQYNCGSVGKLHLFAEADHILDLKCISGLFCQAGSKDTVAELKNSLIAARHWLKETP